MEEERRSAEAEVREKLLKLRNLKEKLDAFDAEISKLVPQAEAMLDSLRLGVPISLKLDEDEDGWCTYLEFSKIGKQWRLATSVGIPGHDDWTVTPLSDVPRDRRADVFERYLPQILDTAVAEMEKRVDGRQNAIASTKNLVDTVSKFVGSSGKPAAGESQGDDPAASDAPTVPNPLSQTLAKAAMAAGAIVVAAAANSEAQKGNAKGAAALMDVAKAAMPPAAKVKG